MLPQPAGQSWVLSFCSIGTILPSRPTRAICRRAQRRSRMARLRATALAARSVLDGRKHDGMLARVGKPIPKLTNRTIKKRDHAQNRNENETESNPEQMLQFRVENRDFCPHAIALPGAGAVDGSG